MPGASIFENEKMFFGDALVGWVSDLDVVSNVATAEQWDNLAQKDMDAFYLRRAREGGDVEEEMAYHSGWSGRAMTPSLLAEDWRRTGMRVAAVMCVYDDTTFLPDLLPDLLDSLDHVVVLVSEVPWKGAKRDNSHTMRILGEFMADLSLSRGRLSVITAPWPSEHEQRQFGNQVVRSLPGNYTHVFVVDGDEFWHPVELQVNKCYACHGVRVLGTR